MTWLQSPKQAVAAPPAVALTVTLRDVVEHELLGVIRQVPS
jgi:hypothetical protein